MIQLGGLAEDSVQYEEEGAQIIAIAVQDQSGAMKSAERTGAQFPFLADMEATVSEAYGVNFLNQALPSIFIINQDGRILWDNVAPNHRNTNRVQSETILEELANLTE